SLPNAPQPEIVMIDLRRDPRLPDTFWLLHRHHPATPAIMITSTLDPGLMLEAMRAGVTECVAEPLSRADLDAAIERVLNQRGSSGAGSIYAFIGAKGGVGCTTIAINVASVVSRL